MSPASTAASAEAKARRNTPKQQHFGCRQVKPCVLPNAVAITIHPLVWEGGILPWLTTQKGGRMLGLKPCQLTQPLNLHLNTEFHRSFVLMAAEGVPLAVAHPFPPRDCCMHLSILLGSDRARCAGRPPSLGPFDEQTFTGVVRPHKIPPGKQQVLPWCCDSDIPENITYSKFCMHSMFISRYKS